MSWRYGVMENRDGIFQVHEIYDENSWTEDAVVPYGETKAELIRDLERMLKDAKRYRTFRPKRAPDGPEFAS